MNDPARPIRFSDIAGDPSVRIFHAAAAEFVAEPSGLRAEISGDLYNHVVNSVRTKHGERFVVSLPAGTGLYLCSLLEVAKRSAAVALEHLAPPDRALCDIRCYLGAVKGQRGEDAVEKLTELGVSGIFFYEGDRSVAGFGDGRAERFARIARSASGQSRRYNAPVVGFAGPFKSIFEKAFDAAALCLVMAEPSMMERDSGIGEISSPPGGLFSGALPATGRPVFIVSGPEGGFSAGEAAAVREAASRAASSGSGARVAAVTLGPSVFRAEFAPVVMTSVIKFLCGDFDA